MDHQECNNHSCRNEELIKNDSSRVRFSQNTVRYYNRTLGDNPACSNGAPISLDWTYSPVDEIIEVDDFEKSRGPRRRHNEMILSPWARYNLLINKWDISMDIIKEVTDEVTLIRESRHRSAQKFMRQSNSFSFGYFFKKLFSFKSKKKRKNVLQRKKLMITSKNLALVYGFPVNGKHVMPPLTDCVPTSEIVSKSSSEDDEEELCSELHSLEVSSCCSLA